MFLSCSGSADERAGISDLLDLTKALVVEFQKAAQIVGFFENEDEVKTINRESKRSILDRSFGTNEPVAESDRFMDLSKVRFR